ncbi:M1 family metallopeptidase [Streptomyces venezuelae]|uniref:Putative metallopeptidase n=1 Tax=Streptomyces venezuelae (strain ATCC 10712 / CBS 650.69 / DSM 40230 / JCM 4526 / NBRC 13096 / PD 04745) TaxID=953739 RepID=F2RGY7_STRVP|nr:metallopeptidase [Streptomyces venezuelae]CCA57315.1 putative metallopeptidase [Streptomyces venezuelae ATCC 10712]
MTQRNRTDRHHGEGRHHRTGAAAGGLAAALTALALLAGGCTGATGGVRGTPGSAGLRDPYFPKLGNGGYDVSHYALTLGYDPATGRLAGTAEITARATQDLSAFNLDLAGLTVERASVDDAPAAVNRAGNELTLRPREEIPDGTEFRATVAYGGVPEPVTDADGSQEGWLRTGEGVVAVGEPTGSMTWFPGNHHPSDKAAYEITLTVPAGFEGLSNGVRTARRAAADGRVTTEWRMAEPMASYLATVAIGRYETTTATATAGGADPTATATSTAGGADPTATATSTAGGADPTATATSTAGGADPSATATAGGAGTPAAGAVSVLTAADRSVAAATAPLRGEIPEILDRQARRFGPYPFSTAGAIVTTDGTLGYALETQTRPVFPAASFDRTTLVHELAHQWFGNSVTPATWRDLWLNEGFATYAEWLYAEEYEHVPARTHFERAFAQDANWAFPPAAPPAAENLFDPPVYQRGAMVLHKLRETVGEERFGEILRGWPAKYRHANASTADFTAYAESVAGRDLDALWDVWLYGDERPSRP